MLKPTQLKLDFLSDIDLLFFFETKIREGLIVVDGKRYIKANNKYLDDIDVEKHSVYANFLDVVNLNCETKMEKLPTGKFHWSDNSLAVIEQTPGGKDIGYLWWLIWWTLEGYATDTMMFFWMLRCFRSIN